jgi:hypothetical protein
MNRVMGETRVDLKPRAKVTAAAAVVVVKTDPPALPTLAAILVSDPICAACKKPGAEARCRDCKTAYCNVICQHADWDAGHEDVCRGL